jgi:hypothetical protein
MSIEEKLVQGEPSRLFPIVAETNKENRIASVFLALLPLLPELSKSLFQSVSLRIGARSKIQCFSEVVFKSDTDMSSRADGLIVVTNGKKQWSALVEFKIGKAELEQEQVERYIKLAKENSIDAVLTISNQFVARADHPPIVVNKNLLKKVDLFHWSWMSIFTASRLLQLESHADTEQKHLLDEFIRFLDHKSTGITGFDQMNKGWREVVSAAKTGGLLVRSSPEVEATVAGWLEEQRDLCLMLSRIVGKTVRQKIESKYVKDPNQRLKAEIASFCETKLLSAVFQVPDAASEINVEADLGRRTIDVSMSLKAPSDRKTTKARMNWLLRMLKSDDERIIVRAHWPSRVGYTQESIAKLRENPDAIQTQNGKLVPHSFEILLIEPLANRFSGPRTFIEDLERIVPEFYSLVGQHLKTWQPAAPKPVEPLITHTDSNEATGILKLNNPL